MEIYIIFMGWKIQYHEDNNSPQCHSSHNPKWDIKWREKKKSSCRRPPTEWSIYINFRNTQKQTIYCLVRETCMQTIVKSKSTINGNTDKCCIWGGREQEFKDNNNPPFLSFNIFYWQCY